MKISNLLLTMLFSLVSYSAGALDYSYSKFNPFDGGETEGESIQMTGEIVMGDYDKLIEFAAKDEMKFASTVRVQIASPGGDINEAIKIARLIKGTYKFAAVGDELGKCVSACFFIYASSIERMASPKAIGIHRPYIDPSHMKKMTLTDAEKYQNQIMSEARRYLQEIDVPNRLIDIMFQNASTEVYWLNNDDLSKELGMRPPWYEQFLISKCGLNKSMEVEYFKINDDKLLDKLKKVSDCADRLTLNDRISFLYRAVSKHKKDGR